MPLTFGPLAQLVEHRPFKAGVIGSSPMRLISFLPKGRVTSAKAEKKLDRLRDISKMERSFRADDVTPSSSQVRTAGFHPVNRGSSPLGVTKRDAAPSEPPSEGVLFFAAAAIPSRISNGCFHSISSVAFSGEPEYHGEKVTEASSRPSTRTATEQRSRPPCASFSRTPTPRSSPSPSPVVASNLRPNTTGAPTSVDIHGSQQIDEPSPERQGDIDAVSAAILEVAANYVSKRRDALALRKFLYDRGCTWPNTARVFLRGLEIAFEGEEGESVAPDPTTHLLTHRRQGLLLRSREGQALEAAKPLRSKIYDFVREESDGRCELCYRRYQIPDIHTAPLDDDHDSVLNLLALCNKCAERVRECPDPLPILKSISERVWDRRRTKAPVWFYCEVCQSGDIELGGYTDEVRDDQYLTVRCNQCGWEDWTEI